MIALTSSGIKDESNDIDSELQSAGTGWSFLDEGTSTFSDFLDSYAAGGGIVGDPMRTPEAVVTAIIDAAPDGYSYSSNIDNASGTPIYKDGVGNYSVDGEVMTAQEYEAVGNSGTADDMVYFTASYAA